MKKLLCAFITLCLCACSYALDPAQITFTNFRSEAVAAASADTFYRGDTIVLTNCIAYSGSSTSSAVQDLTGLGVTVTFGDGTLTGSNVAATIVSTAGVWSATYTLRSNEGAKTYIQVRLTNSAAGFTYPLKYINVKSKL